MRLSSEHCKFHGLHCCRGDKRCKRTPQTAHRLAIGPRQLHHTRIGVNQRRQAVNVTAQCCKVRGRPPVVVSGARVSARGEQRAKAGDVAALRRQQQRPK